MLGRIALLGLALLLSACNSLQVTHDYNPAVNFAQFKTWAWKDPAVQFLPDTPMVKNGLTAQRVVMALSSQLDQRGLTQAAPGAKPGLWVQTYMVVANRQEQVTNYSYDGGPWGGPWAGPWGGYWGGNYWGAPAYAETRNIVYQVGTLQVDLIDAKDGKLVWRGNAEKVVDEDATPAERSAAISKAVTEIMSNYPPKPGR